MKATWDNLKVGVRVKCVYRGLGSGQDYFGKIGKLYRVSYGSNYYVNWEDGTEDGIGWTEPNSMELITNKKYRIPCGMCHKLRHCKCNR